MKCSDSPEPSLLAFARVFLLDIAMSTKISCVGSFDSSFNSIDAKIHIAWLFHNLYIVCASIHRQN